MALQNASFLSKSVLPATGTRIPALSSSFPNELRICRPRDMKRRQLLVWALDKSSSSSSSSNASKKAAVPNSNYVVPLDKSSCITRPLAEILRDLNKRVPDKIIKPDSNYIPWYHANRMLSFYAPGWCGEIRDVIFSDNGSVTVVYRVTIRGSDGEVDSDSRSDSRGSFPKISPADESDSSSDGHKFVLKRARIHPRLEYEKKIQNMLCLFDVPMLLWCNVLFEVSFKFPGVGGFCSKSLVARIPNKRGGNEAISNESSDNLRSSLELDGPHREEDDDEFSRNIWGDILKIFGVHGVSLRALMDFLMGWQSCLLVIKPLADDPRCHTLEQLERKKHKGFENEEQMRAHRESAGTVSSSDSCIEDPVAAAEEIAFCRACASLNIVLVELLLFVHFVEKSEYTYAFLPVDVNILLLGRKSSCRSLCGVASFDYGKPSNTYLVTFGKTVKYLIWDVAWNVKLAMYHGTEYANSLLL
ncbi:hypothetical protein HHK36_025331 [Tetracentron sinense]|uniref:Uncharacterized protein n=1 Tax=Tetracentron sinense TaxID=13715 RepID=A0A834YQP5_TETSI|nr:hypothetical protein HHK36_025331 [Tetracentron sinense]